MEPSEIVNEEKMTWFTQFWRSKSITQDWVIWNNYLMLFQKKTNLDVQSKQINAGYSPFFNNAVEWHDSILLKLLRSNGRRELIAVNFAVGKEFLFNFLLRLVLGPARGRPISNKCSQYPFWNDF